MRVLPQGSQDVPTLTAPRRIHLTRLMSIWRSAGWPCRDAIELDVVAAGWAKLVEDASGRETIRLTDAGIRLLADARQRNQRCLSAHDQLAARVATQLTASGRLVWRELSLRARITVHDRLPAGHAVTSDDALWTEDEATCASPPTSPSAWRVARPDVFSVRRTTIEDYLQPMIHEIKSSRADLLADLRQAAKRESYQWLSCETYFVIPAGVAEPQEIPESFGVWLLNGPIDTGTLELARPARHVPCKLPFAVWMALAKATPVTLDGEPPQQELADLTAEHAAHEEQAEHAEHADPAAQARAQRAIDA